MAQNSVKPFILSSILSSAVTAFYAPLNGTGFSQAPFFIRIVNNSNMGITISYDGVNDHEFIAANTVFDLNSQTNAQPNAQIALFPKYTIVYIKGATGSGNIYLSGYYV